MPPIYIDLLGFSALKSFYLFATIYENYSKTHRSKDKKLSGKNNIPLRNKFRKLQRIFQKSGIYHTAEI